MTRRVVLAIAGVAALAVIGFGIPLGAVIQQVYVKDELVRLEREATAATIEVPKTFGGETVELPRARNGSSLALYLPNGRRIAGRGPARGDEVVHQAMHGQVSDARHRGSIVVAVPVTSSEHVIAVMRASRPESTIANRAWKAWLKMAALGAAVVALAAVGAFLLARRLTRPVTAFAGAVTRLGDGDFSVRAGRSGIGELDVAAAALDSTAGRLGGLLERERAFSADASHQLRTPVTALRVHLEAADQVSEPQARVAIDEALADVERLERTINDLLHVGRDIPVSRSRLDLVTLFRDLDDSWRGRLAAEGRPLHLSLPGELDPVWASTGAVRQILEVLVSNAAGHGAGAVTVAAHNIPGGVTVEVSDEGAGVTDDPDRIFTRRGSAEHGHGIGLALARSLAEAEDGRLLFRPGGPGATFALLFSTPGESPSHLICFDDDAAGHLSSRHEATRRCQTAAMTRWTERDIPDQSGRTALVTGANSGLGLETATALAAHGARVLMACRNQEKAAAALSQVSAAASGAAPEVVPLDLADLASVQASAEKLVAGEERLDLLVNNAGVMALPLRRTAQDHEMQFGTNHLGHFALTGRLLPLLLSADHARVVTLSSGAHRIGRMRWEDPDWQHGYRKWMAYGQSKLANLLFMSELDRKARSAGVGNRFQSVAAHPGYASTHLQAAGPEMAGNKLMTSMMDVTNRVIAQPAKQGAAPTLYAATMPDVQGGEYYGPNGLGEMRGYPKKVQPNGRAKNEGDAARLWDLSEQATGVSYDWSAVR